MSKDDEKIDRGRRLMLGGMAAAPLAIAAAPAAAVVAQSSLVSAIPGVMGVIARNNISVDRLVSFLVDGNDTLHDFIRSMAEFSFTSSRIADGANEPDNVAYYVRTMLFRLDLDNYEPETLSMPLGFYLSPEAKLAFDLKENEGKLPGGDWSSLCLPGDDNNWVHMQQLLKFLEIPADTHMTLGDFLSVARERTFDKLAPFLQRAFRQDPQGMTKALAEGFKHWDTDSYMPTMRKVLGGIDLKAAGVDPSSGSFENYFEDIKERLKAEARVPPKYQLMKLQPEPGNDAARYVFLWEENSDFGLARKNLLHQFPGLDSENVQWKNPVITTYCGSDAERILDSLADNVAVSTLPKTVTSGHRSDGRGMNSIMRIAATASEMNQAQNANGRS